MNRSEIYRKMDDSPVSAMKIPSPLPTLAHESYSESPVGQERPARIFVVDDEETIAWSVTLILNKYGFDATAFYDPEHLLECAKEKTPDLVISDIVMPQMTGIELSIRLTQAHPRCKIMLCSGQAATLKLLDLARKDGHELEVFPKPFSPMKLMSHVRRLLSDATLEMKPALS